MTDPTDPTEPSDLAEQTPTAPDPSDMHEINRRVIEEFRGNGGKVGGMFEGTPLLLLHHTGAKSGTERIAPLAYTRDGDRLVIIASKGGAPTNPDWFHNLVANPTTTVELPGEAFAAKATVPEGEERDRLFDAMAARMPNFAEYQRTTERRLPVVVLERTGGGGS